jgi:hypothetical protein
VAGDRARLRRLGRNQVVGVGLLDLERRGAPPDGAVVDEAQVPEPGLAQRLVGLDGVDQAAEQV